MYDNVMVVHDLQTGPALCFILNDIIVLWPYKVGITSILSKSLNVIFTHTK